MPLPFVIFISAIGVLYIVFAFKEPPEAIRHFFKVPAILVFLPDRWIMPVGRLLLGVGILVGMVLLWLKTNP